MVGGGRAITSNQICPSVCELPDLLLCLLGDPFSMRALASAMDFCMEGWIW